jgi:hypothetical protein
MISAVDSSKVFDALATHLDFLEKQTKTSDLEGDMRSVAQKAYDKLELLMQKEEGLDSDFVALVLNAIKGRFYSPWGIVADLKEWIKNPTPIDPQHYAWYRLCTQRNR